MMLKKNIILQFSPRWIKLPGAICLFLIIMLPATAREQQLANNSSSLLPSNAAHLTAQQPNKRTVRIGLYENKPKIFTNEKGQPSGIFVEIINAIASTENWNLQYVPCKWVNCLKSLESGQIELMPDVAYSVQRAKKMSFHQEKVIESWSQVYANKNYAVDNISDLDGLRIATLTGSIQQTILQQMMKGFGYDVSFVEAQSYKEAFNLVANNHADVVVTNHLFGNYFFQQYGLKQTSIVFNPSALFYATAKGKNSELLDAIDRGLLKMKSAAGSPFYTSLAHWMSNPPKAIVPQYFIWILIGIVSFLVLAFIAILVLRKMVITRTQHLVEVNKQLHQSEEKFRQLFYNHNAIKLIVDPGNGNIIEVNEAAEKFYGWSAEQLHDMRIQDINIQSPGQVEPAIGQNSQNTKTRHRLADGSSRDVEVFTSKVNIKGKDLVHLIVHDVTEYRKLEEQYRQAQKMDSVGRLAGGIAHDYNNMLGVIIGYTELALTMVDSSEPIHPYLVEIYDAAHRSTDITRQLLAFARKQTIKPKVIDINEVTRSMLKMLTPLIGEDITLNWKPKMAIQPVKIDPSQLEQILVNLCLNARDAIAGIGEISIETGMENLDDNYCADHYGFIPGEYVTLTISDNGSGMDRETLDNIFEPFYTTKEVNKGTGLGLSTVYGIVKQNNGFITVYSETGNGTTIRIYLPRHRGETETITREVSTDIPKGHNETILLAEDDPAIREMSRMMLKNLGYHVLDTCTANEAMQAAKDSSGEIMLLLSDVIMPEMNGRDLANKIQSLNPDIKVLFMSGYTADVIAQRGMLDDNVNFIQKPFSMRDLGNRVRAILDE